MSKSFRVDFRQQIWNLKGEPQEDPKTGEFLTLGSISIEALLAATESSKKLSTVDKIKRYDLCTEITKTSNLVITMEQLQAIKDTISEIYVISIIGPAFKLLDAAPEIPPQLQEVPKE